MTKRRTNWCPVAILASALALAFSGNAKVDAAPPHPPTGEESANNLSVPTIFVPSIDDSPFAGKCTSEDDSLEPMGPMGVDTDGDGVPDEHTEYYVQGIAQWQADCDSADPHTVEVAAEWGDNLTNAPLKAGTPIRVEIGFLTVADRAMPGYVVTKLDPTLLDRESHYGTLGEKVDDFLEVRVWDHDVRLDIRSTDDSIVVADMEDFSAEINSTGRIVYGFNWQNPKAGDYVITVIAPNIAITAADAGEILPDNMVAVNVTVGNKGGGKGSGGRPGDVVPGKGKKGR
ncbi:hypothetical protein FYK55_15850 [Roseiconus nitratireducens]|uniref:Uncharacterized protein n=1 Tax=Roseiconus nitratireducens TaxID=2605748 RepID=A0A5M6D7L8_9BACT|nr:hypothetical protein [Roseiconus nitratireducens]KAA5542272.1 hypothetical protein FYK55_15850 [Roseiconus nitratireducens]